jgi:hypothetical protein
MLQFDEKMLSALYKTNMLSWIFIVLAHVNNLQVDMSLHSDSEKTILCSFSLMLRAL